jgi:sec-independent protein translocase protein TatC
MTQIKSRPPKPIPPPPSEPEEAFEDGHELRMSLLDHLNELRVRITRLVLGVVIGTIIGLLFADQVLAYLKSPYPELFLATAPTDPVVAYFRVALMIGAILSIPITTWQVLGFILPGLTKKEKGTLMKALPAITLLFLCGAAFAWFLLVPPAIDFLDNFQSDLFVTQYSADRYLGFVTALIFWMGVAFETPLIFFVLAILGMTTARTLVRSWRIAIVGAAVAAAVITPTPDPVNMFLVMGPLLTLYIISIFLVLIGRRLSKVDA